jgi:hypothetical protein
MHTWDALHCVHMFEVSVYYLKCVCTWKPYLYTATKNQSSLTVRSSNETYGLSLRPVGLLPIATLARLGDTTCN